MTAPPKVMVFAGPNGSGKSTATKGFRIEGIYVNADEIKKQKKCSDLEAAQEAESIREFCLSNRLDFTFETVLSTRRNLDLLHRAKDAGYKILAVYVTTVDPQLNVMRIENRVAQGGHDVPIEKILSRYNASIKNIKELISLSNVCIIVDNTGTEAETIFAKENGNIEIHETHFWTIEQINALLT
jgi:predicted ABC-type ATPase